VPAVVRVVLRVRVGPLVVDGVTPQGPYRRTAHGYRERGWHPIPVRGKGNPVAGYTGRDGADPTRADVTRWTQGAEGSHNVALRLPDGCVGIDVDAHGGKHGADTLEKAVADLGPLPATWSSTSRGPAQPSRIHLYLVPAGLDWSRAERNLRARYGPGVDVLHRGHRYAMAAPSTHPDGGRLYAWYDPAGVVSARAPSPGDLAELPEAWVALLTAPPPRAEPPPRATTRNPNDSGRVAAWQDYNRQADIGKLLEDADWAYVERRGDGVDLWRHPEAHAEHSATLGHKHDEDGTPLLCVFSTSTDFDAERYYDATGVYAVLHHHGDRSAACSALYEQGYGDRLERSAPVPPEDGWAWPTEPSSPLREISERSEERAAGSAASSGATEVFSPNSLLSQPWPVLDPAALHGLAGTIVATLGPQTEADPAGLLVSFLTAFGNMVDLGPHAIAGSAPHPARLNAVLVGNTARARKGTSWSEMSRLAAQANPGWAERCVVSGLSSGEGLIAEVRDPGPDDDPIKALGGVVDKRRLVFEAEFARVLKVAARESNILTTVLRDAWDGRPLRTMTRKDPLRATGAHISVLAHITVEELRRLLTETDMANGFANRFLFCCVRRTRLLPHGGNLDPAALDDLANRVQVAIGKAWDIGVVRRTPDADAVWEVAYRGWATDEPDGLTGAVTARADANTLRLSVAYALLDGSPVIEVAHLRAALAVWRYCEASARYLFGGLLGDDVADRLLVRLREAGEQGLDATEQSGLFGRHVTAARLGQARALLEGKGLAVTTPEKTGGRDRLVTRAVTR
jgi:hypothetical protein